MGGGKKPTTGYKFHMYLHMIFCLGPVDSFRKLLIGDREAWSGNQTVSGTITVDKPELFGGDEREGGVAGELDVMMGESSQAANAYLTTQQGSPQPGYRGLFGLVFRGPSSSVMVTQTINYPSLGAVTTFLPRLNGYIGSNNPYIKGWAALIRRIVSGWRDGSCWYPEKAAINLPDGFQGMNPAHIVYQVLTDPEVGRGLARASIVDANFRAAADAFHAEGLGLTLKWTAQTSVDSFIGIVADHAGFNLIEDRDTGLFRIVLLRNNYTIGTLPTFSESEVRVRSAQRPAPADFVNEIVVKYTDVKTGKEASTTVQNLAAIQAQGRIVSQVINYPGLPTQELANRTGMRDLMAKSSPLWRFSLTMSRKANSLVPGDPFVLNYPPLGVNLVLRPGEIDYGNSADGEILAECVEDVFALPLATYITPQTSGWIAPDPTPQASTAVLGFEVPYRSLATVLPATELAALPADAGYVAATAIRPPGIPVNFALYSRMGTVDYQRVASGDFAPSALLTIAATKTDTVITVGTISDGGLFTVGGAAFLGSEMVQIKGINFTTNQITIGRGCGDTTPQMHAIGTRLWMLDGFGAVDENQYIATDTVNLKLSTIATGGELAIASAPVANVTLNQRATRPYPPAKLTINTLTYPSTTITGPITPAWAHRDRVLQQDQLIDTNAANIGPEAGTTYTVRYYKPANTLVNTQTGFTGTSGTPYTPGGVADTVKVTIESVKSGLASWQTIDHTFAWEPISAFSYVSALLHFNGTNGSTTFTDSTGKIWTAFGNAQISTAQSKFGGASGLFDGAGDYISTPHHVSLNFGTGDFTIEFWQNMVSNTGFQTIIHKGYATGSNGYVVQTGNGDGRINFYSIAAGSTLIAGETTGTVITGTQYHIAIVRYGTSVKIYREGVEVASGTSSFDFSSTLAKFIGGGSSTGQDNYWYNGYIDELRITKGVALYTANFTPPTAPFPDS